MFIKTDKLSINIKIQLFEEKSQICREIIELRLFNLYYTPVMKAKKIRNRYNQVPHLTQDTNGKVTNLQLDTTNKESRGQPFPSRRPQGTNKQTCTKTWQTQDRTKTLKIHKRSTALERSVKNFTGGLKLVSRHQPHP